MRVEEFLTQSRNRFPDKTALVDGSRRTSYALMEELTNRFGNVLRGCGLHRGDRVVIYA